MNNDDLLKAFEPFNAYLECMNSAIDFEKIHAKTALQAYLFGVDKYNGPMSTSALICEMLSEDEHMETKPENTDRLRTAADQIDKSLAHAEEAWEALKQGGNIDILIASFNRRLDNFSDASRDMKETLTQLKTSVYMLEGAKIQEFMKRCDSTFHILIERIDTLERAQVSTMERVENIENDDTLERITKLENDSHVPLDYAPWFARIEALENGNRAPIDFAYLERIEALEAAQNGFVAGALHSIKNAINGKIGENYVEMAVYEKRVVELLESNTAQHARIVELEAQHKEDQRWRGEYEKQLREQSAKIDSLIIDLAIAKTHAEITQAEPKRYRITPDHEGNADEMLVAQAVRIRGLIETNDRLIEQRDSVQNQLIDIKRAIQSIKL